jgi:hypothetical protein
MREKVEAVLLELESIKVSERNWLLNGSEALKHLWDEIESIETKLRTLQKACDLVDLNDQEIAFFVDRIKRKKSDLLSLIAIEKNRELVRQQEIRMLKDQAGREVQLQRRVQVVPAPEPGLVQDISEWIRINRAPIESFCATSIIVVVIQICLNIIFVNQVKVNTQFSVIDPLEQELGLTNQRNHELERKLSALQKEISFYRNLNLPFTDAYRKNQAKTNSVLTVKRERLPASIETILSR